MVATTAAHERRGFVRHGARSWVDYFTFNTDHKVIGIQYIAFAFIFFIIGGLLAMVIRTELAAPGQQFVGGQTYNQMFTLHGTFMIFFWIIRCWWASRTTSSPSRSGSKTWPSRGSTRSASG
jgi:hypothetical protein